ncbi:hypothetical protein H4R35_000909 [Dimargaris xerosporica]|nr:hypothetical protein H4R35_000909 [Dimargaris xerosporica]
MEMALKMGHGDEETKQTAMENINHAARDPLVMDALTPKETTLMTKPNGEWDRDDLHFLGHWESLGVLLWVLSRQSTIPSYYELFARPALFNSTGILPNSPQTIHTFVNRCETTYEPRPPRDVQEAVNRCEAWYWRAYAQHLLRTREQLGLDEAATQSLQSSPTMASQDAVRSLPRAFTKFLRNLPTAIGQASNLAEQQGLITRAVDHDFGVETSALYGNIEEPRQNIPLNDDGSPLDPLVTWVPYGAIDDHGLFVLQDIARHRMLAFSWLARTVDSFDADMTELGSINPVNSLWAPFPEESADS